MGPLLPFLIFGLFVALAILGFAYSSYLGKKRTAGLKKLAEEMDC